MVEGRGGGEGLHQGRDARNVPARYVSIEDRRTIHTIERTIETGCARDVPLSDVLIERSSAKEGVPAGQWAALRCSRRRTAAHHCVHERDDARDIPRADVGVERRRGVEH